jgi:uncharacterized protein (UPF0333 family)
MKTHRSELAAIILLMVGILIAFPAESSAQLKKMDTEDLTKESTAIIHGKCSKVKSAWNKDKDLIFTTVTIVPDEYIKGNLGAEALITIPGGQVDNIIYEVSEMPVFTEGEEVLAFVWTHPSGKHLIIGGTQGKMKIEKDKKTGKKKVKGQPHLEQDILLEEYTKKVKGYLK